MSTLDAATLLAVWDAGASQPALRRALMLLDAAWPGTSAAEWAQMSIGRRDERLLALREELFGRSVDATAACPACGDTLDVHFTTRDLAAGSPAAPGADGTLRVVARDYEVTCRVVTSADLLDLEDATDARVALLRRCVRAVHGEGAVDPAALPADVIETVEAQMARADPQADVSVALTCPGCSHAWSMRFDILAYLWGEIDDWAQRLLLDVHALASAYGWHEREIVAMSARRRRMYLDLVGA